MASDARRLQKAMLLKLKRTPGIFLVGFMGSGKSTVGKQLARQLGWRFADLDEDIEAAAGVTIPSIFDTRGEEEFRCLEAAALAARVREIVHGAPWVVALGGGCFTRDANIDLIANHGVSIFLDCPLHVLRERVAHSNDRPLARDPAKFEALFHLRRPCYLRADFVVPIGHHGSAGAIEDILRLPLF